MNENTLWACFWFACALTIVGLSFASTYSNIEETKLETEYAKAGLEQQVVGTKTIWVKSKNSQ